jgi:hypothetical protein
MPIHYRGRRTGETEASMLTKDQRDNLENLMKIHIPDMYIQKYTGDERFKQIYILRDKCFADGGHVPSDIEIEGSDYTLCTYCRILVDKDE